MKVARVKKLMLTLKMINFLDHCPHEVKLNQDHLIKKTELTKLEVCLFLKYL
jgi:hypothetical protein